MLCLQYSITVQFPQSICFCEKNYQIWTQIRLPLASTMQHNTQTQIFCCNFDVDFALPLIATHQTKSIISKDKEIDQKLSYKHLTAQSRVQYNPSNNHTFPIHIPNEISTICPTIYDSPLCVLFKVSCH
jgi:hypothetical protein